MSSSNNNSDTPFNITATKEESKFTHLLTTTANESSAPVDISTSIDLDQDEGYLTQAVNETDIKRARRSVSRK